MFYSHMHGKLKQVFMITVFWVMTLHWPAICYQLFGGTGCPQSSG